MQKTVRAVFDRAVSVKPRRVFMEYMDAGKRRGITFAEAGVRVRQLAELIAVAGVESRGRPVAMILENGPDWVEAAMALLGSAVTLVPMDPKFRPAEALHILRDSHSCAVITDSAHTELLEKILPDLPEVGTILLFGDDARGCDSLICGRPCISIEERILIEKYRAASPEGRYAQVEPTENDVAVIVYTSGSTGKPKGAQITEGNLYADMTGTLAGVDVLRGSDRFLVVLPLFHSFSFMTNMLLTIALQARMQFVTSLRSIPDEMKRFHPTVMMAVPLMVEKFAAKIENSLSTNRAMLILQAFHLRGLVKHLIRHFLGGSLRLMITGGAPCPVGAITTMRRFGVPVVEGYGLTEASPVVSITPPSQARIGTIGKPLPNIEVSLGDKDGQGIGELLIRGPIVMKGYLNLPEATAETLEGGWLHTGDLASQDADGYLTIRGRKKSLIVNREGKNIYPEEVEQCIARDTRLLDIVVLGYRDHGEVGEKVGAIVVPDVKQFKAADGSQLPQSEIEGLVRASVHTQCGDLATYKHPRKLDVRFEPLKRTASMKIARKAYQGQLDE